MLKSHGGAKALPIDGMKKSSGGFNVDSDLDLKDWGLKARISRENTNSRRFSASNLTSFRDEITSFRSNITNISSTASSPGYTAGDKKIDPSTYSFSTALKALQAKTMYTWEYLSPDGDGLGYTLNSKWSDAEKYISNPFSGRVPLECLSAKTLSGRSSRSLTSRITMSAPLIYPSHFPQIQPNPTHLCTQNPEKIQIQNQDNVKKIAVPTRDVGTQSSGMADLGPSSPTPVPTTPSIRERSINKHDEIDDAYGGAGDSISVSTLDLTPENKIEAKERRQHEFTKRNDGEIAMEPKCRGRRQMMMCSCLSMVSTRTRVRSTNKK